jgi:hypothetical protein
MDNLLLAIHKVVMVAQILVVVAVVETPAVQVIRQLALAL